MKGKKIFFWVVMVLLLSLQLFGLQKEKGGRQKILSVLLWTKVSAHNSVSTEEDQLNIYVEAYEDPANQASPLGEHPIIGFGWSYNNDFSDEFNDPSMASIFGTGSKWSTDYGWGNTHTHHLSFNRTDGANHESVVIGGERCLRLHNKKETYTGKILSWKGDNVMLGDGRPNLRTFEYTSAMIKSKGPVNPEGWDINTDDYKPYGYFEMRARIPRTRHSIIDFWLWSARNAGDNNPYYPGEDYYNEIDIFETDGVVMHQTTHTRTGPSSSSDSYHHHKKVVAIGDEGFEDEFHTYALKWEPNKVIYYMDNKIMRVVTDNIADHVMSIIVNIEMDNGTGENGRGCLSDENFPNYYDIDYVRVFHRADHSQPDPIFRINDEKSIYYSDPVIVNGGLPIIMNAIESYSDNGNYFVSIQECTSGGQLTGPEAMAWLTSSEKANIDNFDLGIFASGHGLALMYDKTYRVKLVAGSQWIEENMYMKPVHCTNSTVFSINGQSQSPIGLGYNKGFPDIRLNGSESESCNGNFFLSVERCDASGSPLGGEVMNWLSSTELANLDNLDIVQFCAERGLTLAYNNYYRVKCVAGNVWAPVMKILHIEDCLANVNYAINGYYGGTNNTVEIYADHNQTEIWMEAYNCTTPYNIATPYFISIETSDQYWGRQGDEIMVWKSYDDAKRFNLRTFAKANGMDLLCGNYYRVKLATSQPTWTSKLMLIHIDDCDNDPEFTINQEVRTDYTPVIVDFNDHAMLNAWGSVSCYDDSYYSLSVQKCDSSGQYPYGTKVYEVLDDIYTNYMGRPASTNYSEGWLSNFDVTVFSGTRGLPVSSGDYYLVTLCTENLQTQKCKEMVIYKDYIKSVDVDFIKFLLHFVLAEVMVFVFL